MWMEYLHMDTKTTVDIVKASNRIHVKKVEDLDATV